MLRLPNLPPVKWMLFLLFCFLALNFNVFAQKSASNEQVIENLFFNLLDSLNDAGAFKTKTVILKFEGLSPEEKAFCRVRLIKYFNSRGVNVLQSAKDQKEEDALVFTLAEFVPRVEYVERLLSVAGFSRGVQRRVRLKLKAWTGNDRLNYWQLQSVAADQIGRNQTAELEQSPYSFTRGKWVTYSIWTRLLEPFIVIGSMSVLIYLFYTLRT